MFPGGQYTWHSINVYNAHGGDDIVTLDRECVHFPLLNLYCHVSLLNAGMYPWPWRKPRVEVRP